MTNERESTKNSNSGEKGHLKQNLFRDILENASDAIVVVDKESRVVFVNSRFEEMLGYSRDEIVGKSHDLLLPKEILEKHRSEMEIYFFSPDERPMGIGLELVACRRDGICFPADISLSPVGTGDGLLIICAIRDMTELKKT